MSRRFEKPCKGFADGCHCLSCDDKASAPVTEEIANYLATHAARRWGDHRIDVSRSGISFRISVATGDVLVVSVRRVKK